MISWVLLRILYVLLTPQCARWLHFVAVVRQHVIKVMSRGPLLLLHSSSICNRITLFFFFIPLPHTPLLSLSPCILWRWSSSWWWLTSSAPTDYVCCVVTCRRMEVCQEERSTGQGRTIVRWELLHCMAYSQSLTLHLQVECSPGIAHYHILHIHGRPALCQ